MTITIKQPKPEQTTLEDFFPLMWLCCVASRGRMTSLNPIMLLMYCTITASLSHSLGLNQISVSSFPYITLWILNVLLLLQNAAVYQASVVHNVDDFTLFLHFCFSLGSFFLGQAVCMCSNVIMREILLISLYF